MSINMSHMLLHIVLILAGIFIVVMIYNNYKKFRGGILGFFWKTMFYIVFSVILIVFVSAMMLLINLSIEVMHIAESAAITILLVSLILFTYKSNKLWKGFILETVRVPVTTSLVLLKPLLTIFGHEAKTIAYHMGAMLAETSGKEDINTSLKHLANIIGTEFKALVRKNENIIISTTISKIDLETLSLLEHYLKGYWERTLTRIMKNKMTCIIKRETEKDRITMTLKCKPKR